MPSKRRNVPPIRPNADGSGFRRASAGDTSVDVLAPNRVSAQATRTVLTSTEPLSSSRGRPAPQKNRQGDGMTALHTEHTCRAPSSRAQPSQSTEVDGDAGACRLAVCGDASLSAQECRLSPATFRRLGLGAAGVAQVRSSCAVAYLEALLTPGLAPDSVVVGHDTAALLRDTAAQVTAIVLPGNQPLPRLSQVTVTAMLDKDAPHSGLPHGSGLAPGKSTGTVAAAAAAATVEATSDEEAASQTHLSPLALRAFVRTSFHNRLVFDGLSTTLRFATHRIWLHMQHLRTAKQSAARPTAGEAAVDFGLFTDRCAIVINEAATETPSRRRLDDDTGDAHAQPTMLHTAGATTAAVGDSDTTNDAEVVTSHVLVTGETGTGKTYALDRLAQADRCRGRRVLVVRVEELPQGEGSEVGTATVLRETFARAKHAVPSTVVLDDLHLICGAAAQASAAVSAEGGSSAGSRWAMSVLTRVVLDELRDCAQRGLDVRVLASTPTIDALDALLRSPTTGLGAHVCALRIPHDAQDRLRCLVQCICDVVPQHPAVCGPNGERTAARALLQGVAAAAHGFSQRDLRHLVERAMLESFRRRGTTCFTLDDLTCVARMVRPSSLRAFEVTVPTVGWDDIGGSAAAKATLREVVDWCLGKQSWIFTEFRLTPPKGVLLYGPPGCSKTMLAKALAHESGMNFISVKGPEVFSKWVGDSEKAVRDVFARARAAAPCVVFIDELDGMCGHRGQGGVSDRVISQFLTELDGLPAAVDDRAKALIFVAATNRPDQIDGAVLRPGRIDRRVYVGLPTRPERAAIALIHLRRLPCAADLTPTYIADRTEGYTGAEVVAVVKEAAFIAISGDADAAQITRDDVDRALRKVRPRVRTSDVEWYKTWPAHVRHDRGPAEQLATASS